MQLRDGEADTGAVGATLERPVDDDDAAPTRAWWWCFREGEGELPSCRWNIELGYEQPLTYCGLQGHARTWWVDHPFTHHASVPDLALLSGPHLAAHISVLDISSHTCAEL